MVVLKNVFQVRQKSSLVTTAYWVCSMVRPILEYGSQVLSYQNHYLKSLSRPPKDLSCLTIFEEKLEQFQTKALKTLIGSPKSASPAIVRLFSGVEPLKSRLDMMKLRYFWMLLHSDDCSIAYSVFKHQREQIFITKNGFIHEVFNFWHGKIQGLNPKSYIKNIILAFSLTNDLNMGRKRSFAFTDIFLANTFSQQKSYHLVELFLNHDFFSSASARCFVTKFLLQSRAFLRKCIFCSLECKDIHQHKLFFCRRLEAQNRLLRSKLLLYNFPNDKLRNEKTFYKTVISKKVWTQFLAETDCGNQVQESEAESFDQKREIK